MEPIQPGRWQHFKGGEYEVLCTARHSETLEEMVVYRALYGEGRTWVRPALEWCDAVTVEGITQSRFTFLGERDS